jgi:multidrug efflux system outer membrane protein
MKAVKLLPLLMVLGGCMVGPDYQRPALNLPEKFAEQAVTQEQSSAPIQRDWWTLFNDPELNRLVDTALSRSADIRLAVARLEEAEAALRETGAALLPELDLVENSTRSRSSSTTATPLPAGTPLIRKNHRLTLATSFELDFWGKLRRASESARAQALASRHGRDVAALTLAASTTRLYFAVRSSQAQVAAARDTLASRVASLSIATRRAEAGLASDLDLNQATTSRVEAAVQLREQERQLALYTHQLGVLVGDLNLQLKPGELVALPLPPAPPAGLPASLLEHRPDVRQAEQLLISANADIGVARAAQFPTFSLSAFYGGESKILNEAYLREARVWSAGLGATLPIIDAGKFAARTERAEARQRQASATYQRAVENAFRDVADTLVSLRLADQSDADQQQRLAAARTTLQLAQERYQAGYSPYLEVLDAQRTTADASIAALRSREQRLGYSVDLFKALGGGWQAPR